MVPKTSTSSSSKAGTSSSSSSSSEFYNKMNEYVLSRTPDQSTESVYLNQVMRMVVASISMEIGWHSAHLSALDVLADLTIRYFLQLAKQSKKYTDHYGRTLTNENDVALGLRDMRISVSELEEYVSNFDPVTIPKEVPFIPVPRKTDLNFLRPGSEEVLSRPLHVHEYMPPMIMEQPEEEAEKENEIVITDAVPVVSEEVQVNSEPIDESLLTNENEIAQNGILPLVVEEPSQVPEVASELVVSEVQPVIVTEEVEVNTEIPPESEAVIPHEENKNVLHQVSIVQNDLEESSDDDIEPAASKAASIFATFKSTKKLESASENAALKRVRKMLEDHGHVLREVTSVMMTSSGYITSSREGRVPDRKPPSVRSFFDPPTLPPKEPKKTTTMKKILQNVKKTEKGGHSDSEEENAEGPGLFGVMDKIVSAGGNSLAITSSDGVEGVGENGILADVNKDISKKKLSKQERKLLHQKQKKELKAFKKLQLKSKDKLLSKAKLVQAAAASKELESSTFAGGSKNKLTIFSKKCSKLDASGMPLKKKKKDKKNKLKLKELRKPMQQPAEDAAALMMMAPPAAPAGTELIESDEDFSTADSGTGVVSPVRVRHPSVHSHAPEEHAIPGIPRKKFKKGKDSVSTINTVKMKPPVLNLDHLSSIRKKFIKPTDSRFFAGAHVQPGFPPIPKTKISKRPPPSIEGEPPVKKKRGRPKKVWSDANLCVSQGLQTPGGPVPLPAAQLASIGKSLMIKEPVLKLNKMNPIEPPLKMMKIRREHMEIQDLVPNVPPSLITKPPTISPTKSTVVPGPAAALSSAELLKRLPAQPGLIPDRISPVPPVRLPKELPASISITPAALSSPQKEIPSSSRGFPGALPPNVCSSVTITRINMSHQQKLPSPYDDSITPGIGPPPGLVEGPHKRNKQLKGVPPPPPLQIPIQAETESGITITPIVMGGSAMGGSGKEHRYDHPLPPPPPLQERPAPKHSMLAKLDEELSSTPPSTSSSSTSKEQKRKEKEKRKEQKKEKKKKAKDKDKSKDKSEKKKKKKDKSGETTSGGDAVETPPPTATVPKLTLKLGGHSNTTTPVDSPNPPQVYHEPPMPTPPPPLKKLSIKNIPEDIKPPKQKIIPPPIQEEEDPEVARFAPLVTRPQKPARAAKANAAAGIAAVSMGASVSHQEIVQFPAARDSRTDSKRGRGRPPKGGATGGPAPATPSSSKQTKSSLTVLETQTVGCITDEHGNKIWICPACGRQDDGTPMIGCDKCDDWYHFVCMGIEHEPSEEESWFCPRCIKTQGKQKKRK